MLAGEFLELKFTYFKLPRLESNLMDMVAKSQRVDSTCSDFHILLKGVHFCELCLTSSMHTVARLMYDLNQGEVEGKKREDGLQEPNQLTIVTVLKH